VPLPRTKEEPGEHDHDHDGHDCRREDHAVQDPGAPGDDHGPMVRRLVFVPTKEDVLEVLRQVEDPELGMDIVDLGLLYEVEVEGSKVKVTYSLTSMGCPAGPLIAGDIDRAAREVPGVEEVDLELTFDPPWTPDKMSDDAKFILGFG
jgi:metal-sulfur cluster biosynthetic enzyme